MSDAQAADAYVRSLRWTEYRISFQEAYERRKQRGDGSEFEVAAGIIVLAHDLLGEWARAIADHFGFDRERVWSDAQCLSWGIMADDEEMFFLAVDVSRGADDIGLCCPFVDGVREGTRIETYAEALEWAQAGFGG